VLISYPSSADMLAQAQADGELTLHLAETWVGGEQLSAEQRQHIRSAFGCGLRNSYGASEFFAIACECAHGRLHLNHDWVIVEPVDRRLRPVAPGEASDAVLLTNLANRTQPLLRYRLDDSLRLLPEPCACGSGFPAIEVQGRADATLALHDAADHVVRLLPLALCTAIEEGAGVTRLQLLCTAPDRLELRLEDGVPDRSGAFARVQAALRAFLSVHGLSNVRVLQGRAAPLRHPKSGKLERVRYAPAAPKAR
jgi:phenylacetate-coenzyme A ligase PaaK-like adenylate-forming protein